MNIQTIHSVYFIGIGGIGMSAIARYFHRLGKKVAGYDKTPTHLTDELIKEGIVIHFEDDVAKIDTAFLNKEHTLVVVTPAVPKEHEEWNFFSKNGFTVKKRAEVLGIITKDTFCLAVAGTHGKTTTSSMLAHILYQGRAQVTSFLGGVVENYQTNLVGDGTEVTVVEADEFDRSFLHLHPDIACIISNDADHLDIYGTNDEIKQSFREFSRKVQHKENLFVAENVDMEGVKVGLTIQAAIQAKNLKIEKGVRLFDIQFPDEEIQNVQLLMPGYHNVLNATLAFAMARKYGLPNEVIKKALADFKGVRRRFSYKIKQDNLVYIDDYAHHPAEINAVHQAVKEMYPDKKITGVFQPHLYSRTRDFMDDFAASLSQFDEVVLLDIYPARELPVLGVTSEKLLDKIENPAKWLVAKEELLNFIKYHQADVWVTIGAGDIGEMVDDITLVLQQRIQ